LAATLLISFSSPGAVLPRSNLHFKTIFLWTNSVLWCWIDFHDKVDPFPMQRMRSTTYPWGLQSFVFPSVSMPIATTKATHNTIATNEGFTLLF
jgi:hypothetical protein